MGASTVGSVLDEGYVEEQAAVARRVAEVMAAARERDVDELESYHWFGPKFTKFDDFEPLDRQDGETTRRLEREAILAVEEFDARVVELQVDVFGQAAVATFVMEYDVVPADGSRLSFRARATLVFATDGNEWLIVHEHLSPFVASG